MSLIKFELTEDHVKLVKQLRFITNGATIEATDEFKSPFGGDDFYQDVDTILNGRPEKDVGVFDEPEEISAETKKKYDEIYAGLPLALEIILSTGSFELGKYKRRYHVRDWNKY